MPQDVVETLYCLCNRFSTSEALGNIPYDQQPTRETLEGYIQHYPHGEDLAFSDLYPNLIMFLHDYEERRKKKALEGNDTDLHRFS